jgi:ATP-dependent Lhr-like helicase
VTTWATDLAQQLLARHGVLTREAVVAEAIPGGFGVVYPVLKAMEESGRLRRGYFVAGLGATQFALAGALDLLRSLRDTPDEAEIAVLAATDPANPYGATLKWPPQKQPQSPQRTPKSSDSAISASSAVALDMGRGPTRTVGATVILVDGALAAYLARGDRQLLTFLPEAEPQRSKAGRAIARALIDRARTGGEAPRGMLIEEIDGAPAALHPMAPFLAEAGFVAGAMGFQATFKRI